MKDLEINLMLAKTFDFSVAKTDLIDTERIKTKLIGSAKHDANEILEEDDDKKKGTDNAKPDTGKKSEYEKEANQHDDTIYDRKSHQPGFLQTYSSSSNSESIGIMYRNDTKEKTAKIPVPESAAIGKLGTYFGMDLDQIFGHNDSSPSNTSRHEHAEGYKNLGEASHGKHLPVEHDHKNEKHDHKHEHGHSYHQEHQKKGNTYDHNCGGCNSSYGGAQRQVNKGLLTLSLSLKAA